MARDRGIPARQGPLPCCKRGSGPFQSKHPCAPFTGTETVPWTGGGSGTVFAQCQMCSGHKDLSAALGRQEQGPAQPWLSPGCGCPQAVAVPGPCPQQGAINHAPASAALPQPPCPRSRNQHSSQPLPVRDSLTWASPSPHHRPRSGHDPTWLPATDVPGAQTLPSPSCWGAGLAPQCPSSPPGEPRRPRRVQGGCHEFLNS